ncbi:hypothetical protein FB45DRAFT_1029548 [Roridomyces roridus]|uniref:Uncharacterized protein n=1 Tax=Roridomyces roridus TaxID=1738132 RepID=A0AAD7BPV0_9AGAR|nr:hypothetical protein FB45DRAFT_1029548 [Roridomyces roridus]
MFVARTVRITPIPNFEPPQHLVSDWVHLLSASSDFLDLRAEEIVPKEVNRLMARTARFWIPFLEEPTLTLVAGSEGVATLLASVEIKVAQIAFNRKHSTDDRGTRIPDIVNTFLVGCERFRVRRF